MKLKKIIKKCMSSVIVFAMLFPILGMSVQAIGEYSELIPYAEELERFNQKYGTAYVFEDEAFTNEEVIAFYKQFTMDEFEKYMYELNANESDDEEIEVRVEASNPNSRAQSSQYVYYGDNFLNYFRTVHTVEYAYNKYIFVEYDTTYYNFGEYPYYTIKTDYNDMNADRTADTIHLNCEKHLKNGLINLGNGNGYNITFTVTPYGGDLYVFNVITA